MRQSIFAIATTVASALSANAATVDINGITYDYAVYDIALEAELGGSVTKSFASVVSQTHESAIADAVASTGYQEDGQTFWYYNSEARLLDFDTFNDVTGFSISNNSRILQDGTEYYVYDLTFAPTIETVANDELYEPYWGLSEFEPGVSQALVLLDAYWIEMLVLDPTHPNFDLSLLYFPERYDGSLEPWVEYRDDSSDSFGIQVKGRIIGLTDPVAPVPLPASIWMLAVGVLVLRFARRGTVI